MKDRRRSREIHARGRRVIPGGVNSPVRAFGAVGGDPIQVKSGHGCRILTEDGDELYDLCGSWGPLILGHAHPEVVEAIARAAADGTSFGIGTAAEVALAETICRLAPTVEQVRLVSSGTEATMTALRLARGATGRAKILKFIGGYHGHSDHLLVSAGSGLLTGGIASSAGVTAAAAADTLLVPYNDLGAVDAIVAAHGDDLAAVIVEPVAGNMGLVPPVDGFLEHLRADCDACGALLILDEVITGFRLACTTYGASHGIRGDLVCLGKIIGGGMPLAVVGGSRAVMKHLAPEGKVYQAGTLSGNSVAVAAGRKTLEILERERPYARLAELGARFAAVLTTDGIRPAQLGSMLTPFCTDRAVTDLETAKTCDTARYARLFHAALDAGVYLPPSQFEVAFANAAIADADADAIAEALAHAAS